MNRLWVTALSGDISSQTGTFYPSPSTGLKCPRGTFYPSAPALERSAPSRNLPRVKKHLARWLLMSWRQNHEKSQVVIPSIWATVSSNNFIYGVAPAFTSPKNSRCLFGDSSHCSVFIVPQMGSVGNAECGLGVRSRIAEYCETSGNSIRVGLRSIVKQVEIRSDRWIDEQLVPSEVSLRFNYVRSAYFLHLGSVEVMKIMNMEHRRCLLVSSLYPSFVANDLGVFHT